MGKFDTAENREKAFDAALNYLEDPKYGLSELYPWKTFLNSLSSELDKEATLGNIFFVEGLEDIPDYFIVVITLTSKSKPAVVQVAVEPPESAPRFEVLQSTAVPVDAERVATVSALTRLSSHPAGTVRIQLQRKVPLVRFGDPDSLPPPDEEFKYNLPGESRSTTLVWMPSLESFSPFLPFYKLDVTGVVPELDFVYLRADFQVDPETKIVNRIAFEEPNTGILGF